MMQNPSPKSIQEESFLGRRSMEIKFPLPVTFIECCETFVQESSLFLPVNLRTVASKMASGYLQGIIQVQATRTLSREMLATLP